MPTELFSFNVHGLNDTILAFLNIRPQYKVTKTIMMHFFSKLKHHRSGPTPSGPSGTDAPIVVSNGSAYAGLRIGGNQGGTERASSHTCAICLSEIKTLDDKQLPCGHHFHQPCVEKALSHDLRCPTCRQSPYFANTDHLDPTTKVYMPIVIGEGVDQYILQLSPSTLSPNTLSPNTLSPNTRSPDTMRQ